MSRELATPSLPDTFRDSGTFTFWNGDKYEGEYLVQRVPLSIMREGKGVYFANDGSSYDGTWTKDFLTTVDEITFPDKTKFIGNLENMVMEGEGSYKFKEDVEIHGTLTGNKFSGRLELIDPTGHTWKSVADLNDSELVFRPVQPFWEYVCRPPPVIEPYEDCEEVFGE